MSRFFGDTPKTRSKTVLLVDIENGSVGSALVRLASGQPPKLFAESRTPFTFLPTRTAPMLLREIEKAVQHSLGQSSLVAARIRGNAKIAPAGDVGEAALFFAPPWAALMPHGKDWKLEQEAVSVAARTVGDFFGHIKTHTHASGAALLRASNTLFELPGIVLLCAVTGEVTEVVALSNGALIGHATIPLGSNLIFRTLKTHGEYSLPEAHSLLSLARSHSAEGVLHNEPLAAAAKHISTHITQAAKQLSSEKIQGMLFVAPDPLGEWFARAMAAFPSDAFHSNATVRALHPHHLMPHIAAHGARPDLQILLEALFVDAAFNRV
jgi:hypothetical protein